MRNYAIIRVQTNEWPGGALTPRTVAPKGLVSMRDNDTPNDNLIPYGYCHCGCGEKTSVPRKTSSANNAVAGQPMKYLRGHNNRRRNYRPFWDSVENCYLVPLTKGKFSRIDACDVDRVGEYSWNALFDAAKGAWYAVGYKRRLHRYILDAPQWAHVDHANGDTLDNRRSNLRLATPSQNKSNWIANQSNNTSGYRGVKRATGSAKFEAIVTKERAAHYLGRFLCPIEAAIARDIAALELHGEFASLNFPELREVFK